MRDGKAFGAEVVDIVKGFIDRTLAPILARLDAVEARQPERGQDGAPGERGPEGPAGKDASPPSREQIAEALMSMPEALDEAVRRYLAANPPPAGKDGRDGIDGEKGEPGRDGQDGAPGRDGVGLAGAIIDRSGSLVLTLSDGTTKDLGRIEGKDGEKGEPGRDGFSLSDFDATLMEDGRTVLLSFDREDQSFKVELSIPAMIYRGVYKEGKPYQKGDTVTWGGSLWHCDVDETTEKPDGPEKHWTLAAKRGRDGRDGMLKPEKMAAPVRVGVPAPEA